MTRPFVTVLLPVRDDVELIRSCLDAVLANDYPRDRLEVLVLDGLSTDGTRAIVEGVATRDPRVRLLDNPGRIQAVGLNIGLAAARGEIVVRVDARTLLDPDYIRTCVELLGERGVANVGGPQRAVGEGRIGRAAAIATTSPFGVGDARFRTSDRELFVETVYLGAWPRAVLDRAGGFDARMAVNEDYELNLRIRRAGGRILLSPRVRSLYRVRATLRALAIQYVRYGRGKARMLRVHPRSLRWRQLAAPALVAGLVASVATLPFRPVLAAIVPAAYAVADLAASAIAGARRGWRDAAALPAVFAVMHVAWGTGFWLGLFGPGGGSRASRPATV